MKPRRTLRSSRNATLDRLAGKLKEELRKAHGVVYAKLPRRTKEALAMAPAEKKRLIAGRKKLLGSKCKGCS